MVDGPSGRRLSRSLIVSTAIGVADEDGLDGVTMRRVGQELGATGMALYRHVASREALIELMIDEVVGRFFRPDACPASWREALAAVARQEWRTYLTHPWVLAATATLRPPMAPNMLASMEHALAAFDGLGLSGPEQVHLLGTVTSYGQGLALSWLHGSSVRTADRDATATWWQARLAELDAGGSGPRYPRLAAVTAELGVDGAPEVGIEREFAFGLERVLDGVEAYLRRRHEAGAAVEV